MYQAAISITCYRCRFIEDQNLRLLQKRPRQAHELSLSHAQVFTALGHNVLEAVCEAGDKLLQVGQLEGPPHLIVGVGAERVQVNAKSATEEHGVLWDYRKLRSKFMKSQICD